MLNDIGLYPKLGEGYPTRPGDKQLARLMERMDISKPPSARDLPTGTDGSIVLPPGVRNWFDWDRNREKPIEGKGALRKCQ